MTNEEQILRVLANVQKSIASLDQKDEGDAAKTNISHENETAKQFD